MKDDKFYNLPLQDWLIERLFPASIDCNPFFIIYDSNSLFKSSVDAIYDLLEDKDKVKLVKIAATSSPSEFIDRIQIVNDFNEEEGWYHHKWIIYIEGKNAPEIEKFQSFLYYERLGISLKFHEFTDFLANTQVGICEKIQEIPLLVEFPSLNQKVFELFLKIPINCWRTDEGGLSDYAFWIAFLHTVKEDPELPFSQMLQSKIQSAKQFEMQDLIFELIYTLDLDYVDKQPQDKQHQDNLLIKGFTQFIQFLGTDFDYKHFIVKNPEIDILKTLTRLIAEIFHYSSIAVQKKTKGDKPHAFTLEKYVEPKKIPDETLVVFKNVMREWVRSSDDLLLRKFREWAKIVREERNKPKLKITTEEAFHDMLTKFDYSGLNDIVLIEYLLEQSKSEQSKSHTPADDEFIRTEVFESRKKMWDAQSPNLWNGFQLFEGQGTNISIGGIWDFTRYYLQYNRYSVSKVMKTWDNVKTRAWELQKIENILLTPHINDAIKNIDDLSAIKPYAQEFISNIANNIIQLNNIFQSDFKKNLSQFMQASSIHVSKSLFDQIGKDIQSGKHIGIILCDGLRYDLLLDLKSELENFKEDHDALVEKYDILLSDSYTTLPSTTEIGFNSILTQDDTLVISGRYEKTKIVGAISEIQVKGGKKIQLRNHKDIENRILSIIKYLLGGSKHTIELTTIDSTNLLEDLRIFLEKMSKLATTGTIETIKPSEKIETLEKPGKSATSGTTGKLENTLESNTNPIMIPVLWYNAIDDHDQNQRTFLSRYNHHVKTLNMIIEQIHLSRIENIYVFTDHGFIFSENSKVTAEIPAGDPSNRYCISDIQFTTQDAEKNPHWLIFTPETINAQVKNTRYQIDDKFTLIFPKQYNIFQKTKNSEYYTHGGISFQENCIGFLVSSCVFAKTVGIQDILVKNHTIGHDEKGLEAYKIAEDQDRYYFDFQVVATTSDEILKAIDIRVEADNDKIDIDYKRKYKLAKSQMKNYRASFKKEDLPKSFSIIIKNDYGKIYSREFRIIPPDIIPDLFD